LLIRQKLFQAQEYLHYLMSQVDQHSLHAPFIFDLYTKVIIAPTGNDQHLLQLRKELCNNDTEIDLLDLGAGSTVAASDKRKISTVARHSMSSIKTARLISRIGAFAQPTTIIELGTSLGLLSLQLHHSCPQSIVSTVEGDPTLSALAKSHFEKHGDGKIDVLTGNIDDLLPQLIEDIGQVDLAVMDANHTLQATLSYFYTLLKRCHKDSVIILDDIHWSKEMKTAWDEIRNHPEVTCSVDLFQIGVVFFKEEIQKQHWTLTF
jgi:predicted O-methyltransferase YrrM